MKRLHVNLKVKELEDSVRFYSTLFAAEPTVTRPDYAKWMLDDPRVNFSIVATAGNGNGSSHGIEHLGIQAETEAELAELRSRIGSLPGGEVFDEGETICCYHASDKTWVTDAQGVSWETFYTSGEADVLRDPAAAGAGPSPQPSPATGEGAPSRDCCATDCCS